MRKVSKAKRDKSAPKKQQHIQNEEQNKQFFLEVWGGIEAGFLTTLINLSYSLLFVTLIWVVFAAIVWPANNAKYFRSTYPIGDGDSLEVWGPTTVPGDQKFIEIEFTLQQKDISNEPLRLSLFIPPEFIVVDPQHDWKTHRIRLNFNGNLQSETQTIRIANARIIPGLKTTKREIQIKQIKEQGNTQIDSISIGAEGTLRTVLRRFGGGGSEFPFFPLTTLFISVAGFAFQAIQQKKRDKEKKEKLNQQSAKNYFNKVRQAIKDGHINLAVQILNRIFQDNLRKYLSESDIQAAQQLINIAKGNIKAAQRKPFRNDWLDETAGALLYAVEYIPKDRHLLDSLLREFPLDKISSNETRRILDAAKTNLSITPTQALDWPIPPQEVFLPKLTQQIEGVERNPFPYEKAEDDLPHLFAKEKALFWSHHQFFETLVKNRGTILIVGKEGSGKTALALALGKFRYAFNDRTTFSCYYQGTPRFNEIRNTLAVNLFSFIEHQPSFLTLLNDEQRNLLAQVIIAELGKEVVLGWLGYASQSHNWKWLEKAKDDEIKRKIWEAEASTHLKLLRDAVAVSTQHAFSNYQWLIAFTTCLRSLNFENSVHLVFDVGDDFTWDWYDETILCKQHRWTEINLHTTTFSTPNKSSKANQKNIGLKILELLWNHEQIKDMATWRWEQVFSEKQPHRRMPSLFANSVFEVLIQASRGNPRRFIRLWNLLVQNGVKTPFTKTDIQDVKKELLA